MSDTCVFCERIAGGDFDESFTIDGRLSVRFEPLNPVVPGHMLFVPLAHVSDAAASPSITGAAFEAASRYAARQAHPFNLITSAGSAATQTIQHLHVHYVPRREDDGLTLPWTGQQR